MRYAGASAMSEADSVSTKELLAAEIMMVCQVDAVCLISPPRVARILSRPLVKLTTMARIASGSRIVISS